MCWEVGESRRNQRGPASVQRSGYRNQEREQGVNVFVLIILVFFVIVPIGQAIAKAIETRATREALPKEPEQAGRLEELERQVMYLVEQVEGVQDNQDFLTRLLENRPSSIPPAHSEDEIT
jgi:hypothetical protein